MGHPHASSWCVVIAGFAALTGACAQHRVASSFVELEPRVKTGRTIYVTSVSGDVRKGRLEKFSAAGARMNVSGVSIEVLERDTVQIAVPEPLWQGAVIGAVAGAAAGAAAQQSAEAYGCALGSARDCHSGTPVGGVLLGTGLGAAIGTAIDALIWKHTRVFTAPDATRPHALLAPALGRRSLGLRLTAMF